MNTIKKIYSLFIFTFCFLTSAVYQDGAYFPDHIELYNSSAERIRITYLGSSIDILPRSTGSICVAPCKPGNNYLSISQGESRYRLHFPIPNWSKAYDGDSNTDSLDFATIQFLTGKYDKASHHGIDEICIHNDLLYKIAVMFSLNKAKNRSAIARIAKCQETISQIVRDQAVKRSGPLNDQLSIQAIGQVNAPIKIAYCKRSITSQDASADNTWNSITLSAKTLQAFFNNGYSLTVY
jgi:hypothetical protein